jgi:hypothetical protein
MKKKLNVDVIQNELRGGSAFFPGYKGSDSPPRLPTEPAKAAVKDSALGSVPVTAPQTTPPSPQKKRAIRTRHPFDIYEDQYIDLRKLSLKLQMKGIKSSMSQMVREALDPYIAAKKKEQK